MLMYLAAIGSRGFKDSNSGDVDLVGFVWLGKATYEGLWYKPLKKQRMIGEFDLTVRDIRDVLTLMAGSNVSVYEWLMAPKVLYETTDFIGRLRTVAKYGYCKPVMYKHYVGIAVSHLKRYGPLEPGSKRWLFVSRALCAAKQLVDGYMPDPMKYECGIRDLQEELDMLPKSLEGKCDHDALKQSLDGIWRDMLKELS